MSTGMNHAAGSPLPKINRAWRLITAAVITTAISYKVWRNYTRLDGPDLRAPPGSFTGATGVEPVKRKSKFEGAGNSALGRGTGDRFT